MTDPSILGIFTFVFLILGLYNAVILGSRRLREARERGRPIVWYKQINVLTGVEYMLLALVFMLSIASRTGSLPPSLRGLIFPSYLILLLAAAVIAGFVIRQSLTNARKLRAASKAQPAATAAHNGTPETVDKQPREVDLQRQRERRRNAAAARRRRAGKA